MTDGRMSDFVPVLSRGKHRTPRKGACFMELASFLAAERWTDHPSCTHPLLATVARDVNDLLGDDVRHEIAPLVPDVIGLNSRDPRIDAMLAREVALAALPVASEERQRVAALGLLRCERVLNELEGRPRDHVSERVASALADVPGAHDWAVKYRPLGVSKYDEFARHSAPAIVHSAVLGIAEAAVDDPDQRLVRLLRRVIAHCAVWMHRDARALTEDEWQQLCELTSTTRTRVRIGR